MFCCSAKGEDCKHSFCLSRQESLKTITYPEENYLSSFCVSCIFLKRCGSDLLTNPLVSEFSAYETCQIVSPGDKNNI